MELISASMSYVPYSLPFRAVAAVVAASLFLASCSMVEKPFVEKQVLDLRAEGPNMAISAASIPGSVYQLEKRQSLNDKDWVPVGGPVTAASSVVTLVDSNATDTSAFYRIVPFEASGK